MANVGLLRDVDVRIAAAGDRASHHDLEITLSDQIECLALAWARSPWEGPSGDAVRRHLEFRKEPLRPPWAVREERAGYVKEDHETSLRISLLRDDSFARYSPGKLSEDQSLAQELLEEQLVKQPSKNDDDPPP